MNKLHLVTSMTVLIPALMMAMPASKAQTPATQPVQLPKLPYAQSALRPYISSRTMSFHYGKHHQGYVDNLNKMIAGTPMAEMPLEKIVKETSGVADKAGVFNNAAQIWNHTFYWNSLKPNGGGKPTGAIAAAIDKDLGGYDKFKADFAAAAVTQFGSGWAWLVSDAGTLKIVKTGNAEVPLTKGQTPLLTIDVWEHAYYLDYQNLRAKYVETLIDKLLNWDFANKNFAG